MTALAHLIAARIAAAGPITLADYMADCLMHPTYGYYATRDPFGAAGDFTTAPEISQMFGELLGLCLAQCWINQDRPAQITLAELGPGRGTLMADALRATRAVPGFHDALSVHLVETSATLRGRQQATLAGHSVTWHCGTGTLPQAPLYLVANEFFDALPIRQFQRAPQGWRERVIGLTGRPLPEQVPINGPPAMDNLADGILTDGILTDGMLALGLADRTRPAFLTHRLADTTPGDVVEICPALEPILADIATRIGRQGGAALIVDYGHWRSKGDTFQAVKNHAATNPFAEPGLADLTAHVDFEALAKAALPHCAVTRMTPQGTLLHSLGIDLRAKALARNLSGAPLASHSAAYRRLTHPAEMGNLFQTLGLYPANTAPPPGFDP